MPPIKPYKEGICHRCRENGDRSIKPLINNLCSGEPFFHYQEHQEGKTKAQLEKETERKREYLAKQLAKQKEYISKHSPSVYIELPSGEKGTLEGKEIKPAAKPVRISKGKKEKSISDLINQATEVFNRWIRHRDCPDGYGHCISCNDLVSFEDMQCGHFWPKGSNGAVRFDEINNNGQCFRCNCELHGNQTEYLKGLYKKYGSTEVEALAIRAKQSLKWDRQALIEIIEKYKSLSRLDKAG